MGELIKVDFNENYFSGSTVKAREVHEVLGAKQDFTSWFKYHAKNMGLVEDVDYVKVKFCSLNLASKKDGRGGHNKIDYIISVDIAKHLCMASQTPMSHEVRKYFIEAGKRYCAEKALWDDPDLVIARALKMAEKKISDITRHNL